jgi:hypothetical protein
MKMTITCQLPLALAVPLARFMPRVSSVLAFLVGQH